MKNIKDKKRRRKTYLSPKALISRKRQKGQRDELKVPHKLKSI